MGGKSCSGQPIESQQRWQQTQCGTIGFYRAMKFLAHKSATRSLAQFRGDMYKVIKTWIRRIAANSRITVIRLNASYFLFNFATVIDLIEDDFDSEDEDDDTRQRNKEESEKHLRMLGEVKKIREQGVFADEELQSQAATVEQAVQRVVVKAPASSAASTTTSQTQQSQQESQQQQSTSGGETNRRVLNSTPLWQTKTTFFAQFNDDLLPLGRRSTTVSFLSRLPQATANAVQPENSIPTLEMFEHPPQREITQNHNTQEPVETNAWF